MSEEEKHEEKEVKDEETTETSPEPIQFEVEEEIVPDKPAPLQFEVKVPKTKKRGVTENEVLRKHSFATMRSERRFPYHKMYQMLLPRIAVTFFAIMMVLAMFALIDEFNGNYGLERFVTYVVVGLLGTFSLLLTKEVLRFFFDFHDTNYMNVKIQLETLKTLNEINENLKK